MRNDKLRNGIIARRKSLNLTQEKAADKIGISPNTYQRWEKNPGALSLDKLDKIAQAFSTTRQELQNGAFVRVESLEEPQAGLDAAESHRESNKRLSKEIQELKNNNHCLILLAEKLQAENDSLKSENASLKAELEKHKR